MKLTNNKIVVRVAKNDTKTIKREDGTEIELVTKVDFKFGTADDSLTLKNKGIVEYVCEGSKLKVGDEVFFDPALMGNGSRYFEERADETLVWCYDTTTYHTKTRYYYSKNGRREIATSKGEIYNETQIYAIRRDGVLYGNNTWHLFGISDDYKEKESKIFYKEDSQFLCCVADNINLPSSSQNFKGQTCVINKVQNDVMYIPLTIDGVVYGVVSSEDVIAIMSPESSVSQS